MKEYETKIKEMGTFIQDAINHCDDESYVFQNENSKAKQHIESKRYSFLIILRKFKKIFEEDDSE